MVSRRGTSRLGWTGLLLGLAAPLLAEPASLPRPAGTPPPAFLARGSEARVRVWLAQAARPGLRRSLASPQALSGLLRFEDRVEVAARSPERAVDEAFAGQDLRHGPTFASAPTVAESRGPARFDPNPESATVDLLGLGLLGVKALAGRLGRSAPPRYFLYAAVRADGSARLTLREGRLPARAQEQAGLSYRELGAFTRLDEARRAQAALEEGGPARLQATLAALGP